MKKGDKVDFLKKIGKSYLFCRGEIFKKYNGFDFYMDIRIENSKNKTTIIYPDYEIFPYKSKSKD